MPCPCVSGELSQESHLQNWVWSLHVFTSGAGQGHSSWSPPFLIFSRIKEVQSISPLHICSKLSLVFQIKLERVCIFWFPSKAAWQNTSLKETWGFFGLFLKMKQGNKGPSCNAGFCSGRNGTLPGGKHRMRQLCSMSCALKHDCVQAESKKHVRYLNFSRVLFHSFPVWLFFFFPHKLSMLLSWKVREFYLENRQWVPVPVCYGEPQNYGRLHRNTVLLHFMWVINRLNYIWTSFKMQNYLR